jgi:hypothetical protein
MGRQITIRRERGYYGCMRALEIVLDGHIVGTLRQGEELVLDLPHGADLLWGAMDWGRTEQLSAEGLENGQTVTFRGVFTLSLFRGLGLGTMPFRVTVG